MSEKVENFHEMLISPRTLMNPELLAEIVGERCERQPASVREEHVHVPRHGTEPTGMSDQCARRGRVSSVPPDELRTVRVP